MLRPEAMKAIYECVHPSDALRSTAGPGTVMAEGSVGSPTCWDSSHGD